VTQRPQPSDRASSFSIISRRGFAQCVLAAAVLAAQRGAPPVEARKRKKKPKPKPNKCPSGITRCGKQCRDLGRDPRNCGRCGNACGPNTICDAATCRPCDVCAQGCANTTVQAGIAATDNGGTLVVCPGTYTEAIAIGADITLVGAGSGAGGTTLDAQRTASVVSLDDGVDAVARRRE
jgi:hypothetical protein